MKNKKKVQKSSAAPSAATKAVVEEKVVVNAPVEETDDVEEEDEVIVAPAKKIIFAPEGMTGSQLKRKVVLPQTSAKAQELIAKNHPEEAEKAKTTLKDVLVKAKAVKAEKAVKTEKKAKEAGKYVHNITSMEKLGQYCVENKLSEEEIAEVFIAGYALKGVTDLEFIAPRIEIYLKIGRKNAAKKAEKALAQ